MLRIAIVDDNEEIVTITKNYIEKAVSVPVSFECYINPELLKFDVEENSICDIYFLDIDMPKVNGLDLAKYIRLKQEDAHIVFLTSHPEFALQSYDVKIQAFQYILKAKMKEQLPEVIRILEKKIGKKNYYTIQTQVRFAKVDCEEILYIYKDGKNVVFVTQEGSYKERKTLEKVVEDINLSEIIFIERGYAVNILHIKEIRNNVILMDNGEELYISRMNVKRVKQEVNEYWRKNL